MSEQQTEDKTSEQVRYKKRLLLNILCGAMIFGAGGAIGALTANGPIVFIFPIMGAVGGLSIGLLMGKRARAMLVALTGAAGFGIASLPVLVFSGLGIGSTERGQAIPLWGIIVSIVLISILGAFQGLIGGISLGLGLKDRAKIGQLAIGGTLGFAISAQASWGFLLGLPNEIIYAIWATVGGAILGATLSYLENRKITKNRPS